eukprot:553228_1
MCKQKIIDKDQFWNQLGFEIRKENSQLIAIIARHSLLMHNTTYQQDEKEITSTILDRLVDELALEELLMHTHGRKAIDYLLEEVKALKTTIVDNDMFWQQIGFRVKNEYLSVILVIAKHPSLMHSCTYKDAKTVVHTKTVVLQRLVAELGLDEILTQMSTINKIDHLLTQDKDAFWNKLNFEIKNKHNELILLILRFTLLKRNSNKQDDELFNITILSRLVQELTLNELLKQYFLIDSKRKIDNFLSQMQTLKKNINKEPVLTKTSVLQSYKLVLQSIVKT